MARLAVYSRGPGMSDAADEIHFRNARSASSAPSVPRSLSGDKAKLKWTEMRRVRVDRPDGSVPGHQRVAGVGRRTNYSFRGTLPGHLVRPRRL